MESGGMCQHILWLCTVQGAPGRPGAEDVGLNLPTSPLERSFRYWQRSNAALGHTVQSFISEDNHNHREFTA